MAPELVRWSADGFILFQIVGMVGVIAGRVFGHQPGTGIGRPILSLVMIWNMLLALPTAVLGLIWLVVWKIIEPEKIILHEPGRTIGMVFVLMPIFIALLGAVISLWQLRRFRIQRINLAIPNLPVALKGLTIVHLSDLHIGKLTRGKVLDDMVAATNQLDADLVLLTGDLINMSLEDLPKGIAMMRAMKSRYGVYSCEGNHDLIEDERKFEAAVKASGIPFLLNESVTISVKGQAVRIVGLRWGEGMGRDGDALAKLMSGRDDGRFTILLAHNPAVFDAAAAARIPLTLAGHTHGGQLMLGEKVGFGPWFFKYWSGLYETGLSRMIVSNGAGNWFPLRVYAPAEIIHLTLE